jgi:hypothetical protein
MASFTYVRLYADADGRSHLEDVVVELDDSRRGTDVSAEFDCISYNFARFRDDYHFEQHTAPRRRFVVILTGAIEVEAGDGEVRVLGPGTVLLAEDTSGVGHRSRIAGSGERLAMFVQLPE